MHDAHGNATGGVRSPEVDVPIATFTQFVLFAGPSPKASSLENLVSYGKAKPGKLTFASGDGTSKKQAEMAAALAAWAILQRPKR